jgi:diguanylate cyclase (GGDEF)-like protein
MSFWKRRSGDPQQERSPQERDDGPPRSEARSDSETWERGIESLVFALRSWAQFPVGERSGSENVEAGPQFESWAKAAAGAIGGDPGAPPPNWDGLDRFLLEHRKLEQRTVAKSIGDLREALWAFVECLGRSSSEDLAADGRSVTQIARLREVVASNDVAAIKREAILAAQSIHASIDARQQRQRSHIEKLSTKLEHLAAELVSAQRQGTTDPLTGVYNRAALDAHLKHLTEINFLVARPPVMLVIDIDHFKWANDTYGHEVGDQLLRQLGARLRATCREKQDFIARFGGDEFVIVVEGADPGTEVTVAERVLFTLSEIEIATSGEPLRVSASIGSARCRAGDTTEAWFRRADQALYQAKRAGRDRHVSADAKPA